MSTEWRDDKSDSTAITPAPPAPSTPKPKKAANGGDVETGSGVEVSGVVHDAVFGDIVEHGPNFRAVSSLALVRGRWPVDAGGEGGRGGLIFEEGTSGRTRGRDRPGSGDRSRRSYLPRAWAPHPALAPAAGPPPLPACLPRTPSAHSPPPPPLPASLRSADVQVNGWGAFVLMTKANLGLGVLAIPVVFSTLGIVPGIIVIVVIEAILMYCASFLGPFKIAHPEVYGLADAGYVFGGRWGKEIFYGIFSICKWRRGRAPALPGRVRVRAASLTLSPVMVFCTASAIVGVSTALNAMSSHGACTAIFLAVAAIAGFLLGSIRTLGKVSWVGWAGITSVMVSIVALTIAVGVQERPSEAPRTGPWDKKFQVVGTPTFAGAMTAINIILFSCELREWGCASGTTCTGATSATPHAISLRSLTLP